MALFDDEDKKSTKQRQDEITGHQHTFHSLPKEFQVWHNTQYVMEKKINIDQSTVPQALLNNYMWKVIGDASLYGIATAINIIAVVIKIKFSPTFLGFIFSLFLLAPWLLYTAYHFSFYAKIRAQVVGPVTAQSAWYISTIFYQTFGAVAGSLVVAFMFVFSILESIADLLRRLLAVAEHKILVSPEVNDMFKSFLISTHNFIADMVNGPDDWFGQLMFNTYSATILFTGITAATIFLFERSEYKKRKAEVESEIIQEQFDSGYPIEKALYVLHKWRRENE